MSVVWRVKSRFWTVVSRELENGLFKIFTSFGQNIAEFYDKHILLTMLCIFWSEFVFEPGYFALHLTENGKVF